jgi:hypothetical protein
MVRLKLPLLSVHAPKALIAQNESGPTFAPPNRVVSMREWKDVAALTAARLEGRRKQPELALYGLSIVLIDSETLSKALKEIAGCHHCRPDAAIPFRAVLDHATRSDPHRTRYILLDSVIICPCCRQRIVESARVAVKGLSRGRISSICSPAPGLDR